MEQENTKEVERKKTQVLKQYKKVDYIEREVRKAENKHIEAFAESQTIDIDELVAQAGLIHVSNLEKRANLAIVSEYKVRIFI